MGCIHICIYTYMYGVVFFGFRVVGPVGYQWYGPVE